MAATGIDAMTHAVEAIPALLPILILMSMLYMLLGLFPVTYVRL